MLVQRRRDKTAAVKLLRKLLKKQGSAPDVLVTDKLRSYGAVRQKLDCRLTTSGACARTIGLRIRISRHGGASARCSVSSPPGSASCPFTPPSTTSSTFSAISHPAARSESSGTKRSGRGGRPPRPEFEPRLLNFAPPIQVAVTRRLPDTHGKVTSTWRGALTGTCRGWSDGTSRPASVLSTGSLAHWASPRNAAPRARRHPNADRLSRLCRARRRDN
jgi:hypothetical protein